MAELYEYLNTGDDGTHIMRQYIWYAQTFTPLITHQITSVKFLGGRNPENRDGDVTLSIRATSANKPTGEDLTAVSVPFNDLPAWDQNWIELTFPTPITLQADTQYAILLRWPNGTTDIRLFWRYDYHNGYPRGMSLYSNDSGASWDPYEEHDNLFEDWGGPAAPSIETLDATNIMSDQADLKTKVTDDMGKTLSVRHNYGKTTAYGMNTPWQGGKHTNDIITQTATDLDPETLYHFRGEAVYED